MDLPQTHAFVMKKLKEYGYEPVSIGKCGVTCTVGKPGGKVFMLRADMDALPMPEESALPFAACNGHDHSCGHDCHTAMLLGAAKMLKERENELAGTVKFMFQSGEEVLGGAKDMVENGLLENPHVDAAMALHVEVAKDDSQVGVLRWAPGTLTNSGDSVKVYITGHETHGSLPHTGVDAVHIACTTVLALEEVLAKEIPMDENSTILVGRMDGGTSCNSVPGEAMLDISIRACGYEQRAFLLRRIEEIATGIAATFRGKVRFEHPYCAPPMVNNNDLLKELVEYAGEMLPSETIHQVGPLSGGEDFAYIAERIPAVMMTVGAGSLGEGYTEGLHNPKTILDEGALPIGAAVYAHCAARWLEANR